MLRFPNEFSGDNYSVNVVLNEFYDFRDLLKEKNDLNLFTNEIIITFSKMKSTINEIEHINYYEVIFKIVVKKNDKKYLFPLITFVNNEISLIRGYFLGFYKIMDNTIIINENKLYINNQYVQINLDIKKISENEHIKNDFIENLTYPFLLYKNFFFSNKINEKGYYTLKCKDSTNEFISYNNIENKDINLFNLKIKQISNIYSNCSGFTLVGTQINE